MKLVRFLLVIVAIQLTRGRTWVSEEDSQKYHRDKEEEEFGFEIFSPISSPSRRSMQAAVIPQSASTSDIEETVKPKDSNMPDVTDSDDDLFSSNISLTAQTEEEDEEGKEDKALPPFDIYDLGVVSDSGLKHPEETNIPSSGTQGPSFSSSDFDNPNELPKSQTNYGNLGGNLDRTLYIVETLRWQALVVLLILLFVVTCVTCGIRVRICGRPCVEMTSKDTADKKETPVSPSRYDAPWFLPSHFDSQAPYSQAPRKTLPMIPEEDEVQVRAEASRARIFEPASSIKRGDMEMVAVVEPMREDKSKKIEKKGN